MLVPTRAYSKARQIEQVPSTPAHRPKHAMAQVQRLGKVVLGMETSQEAVDRTVMVVNTAQS
eukprot:13151885-Alexandrium_andersonii.AAC.1